MNVSPTDLKTVGFGSIVELINDTPEAVVLLPSGADDSTQIEAARATGKTLVFTAGTWLIGAVPIVLARAGGESDLAKLQANWYLDAAAGDDNNTGGVGHPIQTWNELRRRMDGQPSGILQVVHLAGNYVGDIIVDWPQQGEYSGTEGMLRVVGTPVLGAEQTVGATSTNYVPATPVNAFVGVYGAIENAALVTGWTVDGVLGKPLQLTDGAHSGAWGYAVTEVAGLPKRAYFQPFYDPATGLGNVEPVIGGKFKVATIPKITGRLELAAAPCRVQLEWIELDNTASSGNVVEIMGSGTCLLTMCVVRGTKVTQRGGYTQFAGCHVALTDSYYCMGGAMFDNWGNWWSNKAWTLMEGALCDTQGNIVMTGAGTIVFGDPTGSQRILDQYWICFLNSTGYALNMISGGNLKVDYPVWGHTTGSAIAMDCGASIQQLAAYPVHVAADGDEIQAGGLVYHYVDEPIVDFPRCSIVTV
jgi:hypothetical protein